MTELPATRLWAGTTVPEPSAAVSTRSWVAVPALTVTEELVLAVMGDAFVSVAVTVAAPAVLRVTLNV